jgi:mono/diheme cytochrome c family protein
MREQTSSSCRNAPVGRLGRSVLGGIASLALAATAWAFDPVTLEDYSGAQLYMRFCASCHGSQAMGDGPVSRSLNVAVPDLTRIASRYGEFPAGRVRDIIDGRGIDTLSHGTREMPVWGYEFWVEEGADPGRKRPRATPSASSSSTCARFNAATTNCVRRARSRANSRFVGAVDQVPSVEPVLGAGSENESTHPR